MRKHWLWFFTILLSSALVFSGVSMVLAQEDADATVASAEDADKDSEEMATLTLDEIVITGSRIAREGGFGQISPVTVIGLEDIKSLGLTRIEDVLNSLPQLEAAQTSFISNGASGTASLDLRGLTAARTLVLINGRRMQPGGTNIQYVDVNQIPAAMIDRVEVLTGGASATYGADAVAGVVNFIMRRVDGVEISLGMSGYQHDNSNGYIQGLMDLKNFPYPSGGSGIDGKAYNIDLVVGSDFAGGKGNATVYANWRKNDELRQEARDYSSCALDETGTSCGGSGNAIVPNFYMAPLDADGLLDWNVAEYLTLGSDSALIESVGNQYNYAPINHFMRPDERWSAGGFADLELNDQVTLFIEVQYANDGTRAQIAESGTFFAEEYYLPVDNSLFPAAFQSSLATWFPGESTVAMLIGKRNVEGGPRSEILDHSSFRIVGGVKGDITDDWTYNLSYLKGRTSSSSTYINDFFAPRIATAVDGALCAADSDCMPYQVFTYQGITSEQSAALTGIAISSNQTSIEMISAQVTGDLGVGLAAGNIMVAGGYEYREETFEDIRDAVYEEGMLLGQGGPRPSLAGQFTVSELFAEANIPLLADMPFAVNLTLDLAYRFSDYTTTGTSNTYRVGLDWQAIDMVRVRTGYNRAVRAPNIEELFEAQFINLWSGVDPCGGDVPIYTAAQCANTGVTAAQYGNIALSPAGQYNLLRGGNLDLEPEEADTITFGVVVDPIDNLTVSVDYWDIKIDGTIAGVGPEVSVDQCALTGNLCDLVHRQAGSGSLWVGSGYVASTQQNIGEKHFQGIDLAASYSLDALRGIWDLNLLGTYLLKKETTPLPSDPTTTYDCVGVITSVSGGCYPSPEWRHTASVTYDSKSFWEVTGRWRHFGGLDYNGTVDTIVAGNMGAQNYLDLNAVFTLMDNYELIIGVNNVMDDEPPIAGNSISDNGNAIAGYYDTLGRFMFTKVTLRF